MLSLSSRGYRAIASDLRGYGDSDRPTHRRAPPATPLSTSSAIWWAYWMRWAYRIRPDLVVFQPRNPKREPVESMRVILGDDYYICRFQEPGEAEEEFAKVDTAILIKKS